VALCATDFIEVVVFSSGTHALLDCDSTVVRSDFVSHEIRLERHHASHREQQGGVMWNQACGWNNGVSLVSEIARKGPTKRIS
jgi:hypothetical protein